MHIIKKICLIVFLYGCLHQLFAGENNKYKTLQFTSKENDRVHIDSLYYYHFEAHDSSGGSITYSVNDLPGWLRYDKDDHSLSGKPARAGQYLIHIIASGNDTLVHQRFMLTVFNAQTVNILTLGNSITNGTNRYNSYRRALWKMLHTHNYNFDFIGSWNLHHMGGEVPNPDFDMDNEGHSGWKAGDILDQPAWDTKRGNIYDWIKTYTPDIILLELGTNEVFQCVPAADVLRDISSIISVARDKNPRVKIFLAQIPPLGAQWVSKRLCGDNVAYGEAVNRLNDQIKKFAAEKNSKAAPVIPVDQYSGLNAANDFYDDIHPNEQGEQKMAERWYKAIHPHIKRLKN